MSGYFHAALASALIVLPSAAQDERDTLVYPQQEVVVMGSFSSEAASRAATFTRTISGQDLERLDGEPVDRVLRRSGLVYVRDRGGRSSVTTVGLRGNTATQTSVTLNGYALTNEQNGIVDMGLYPLDILGGIEIQRGAQSAFTGSGGIGGAINLKTQDPRKRSTELRLRGGSFGTWSAALRLPLESVGLPASVKAGWISDRGSFPYDGERYGVSGRPVRSGNGSTMAYGLFDSRLPVGADGILSSMVYLVHADRSSPGPASLQAPADAMLMDDMVRLASRYLGRSGAAVWEVQLSGQYHTQRYVDRSPLLPVDDSYRNHGLTGAVRTQIPVTDAAALTLGLEAARYEIDATAVSLPGGSDRGAATMAFRSSTFPGGPTLYPSVRWDVFSDLGPILSWRISAHQPVISDGLLTARVGAGSGFRRPSFNERYWIVGGNPSLRHERALMVEGGVLSRFVLWGTHEVEMLGHWSEVTDKIVGWPPENAERAGMLGGEVTWTWDHQGLFMTRTGVALAEVRSIRPYYPRAQFPYIPRITASAEVMVSPASFDISTALEYVSRRYSTVENIRALSSDPYTVLSVSVARSFTLAGVQCKGSCFIDNVLGVAYEVVRDYPMPGRSFHLSLAMEIDG